MPIGNRPRSTASGDYYFVKTKDSGEKDLLGFHSYTKAERRSSANISQAVC